MSGLDSTTMPEGPEPTRAELEASEWLVLLASPVLPQHEIERFQTWLAASEEHKRAWDDVSRTWDRLGPALAALESEKLQAGQAFAPTAYKSPTSAHEQRFANRRRLIAGGALVAACAAGFVFLAPLPGEDGLGSDAGARVYTTAAQEPRTLNLSDGTRIEMSPLAELAVSMDQQQRRIELRRGIAFFDVAHNPARPFNVRTPFGEIRVLGTAFVVRVGDENATATVLRGTVEGAPPRGATLWARTHAPPHVRAEANQEITLGGPAAALEDISPATTAQRLAWREGMVALDEASLREAAAEVTRYSGVRFTFVDSGLGDERVSGYFDGRDTEGFLAMLRANFAIEAEPAGEGAIALRRAGDRPR